MRDSALTDIVSIQTSSNQKILKKRRRLNLDWLGALPLLAPTGVWFFFLLVLPTLIILELSFVKDIKPGDIVQPNGFDNYIRILDPVYLEIIKNSVLLAAGTTLICLILALPTAYWIAQKVPKRWQNFLLLSIILPFWTSSLLRSYAWITILRPTGLLNTVLSYLDLPSLEILNTTYAVLIGMSYSLLPYMVLILYASLEKLDKRLLEAAADLGASPIVAFWKVTVPQALTGIIAGCFLVFITALGDYVNPQLLGGASSMTITRLIYNQFLGLTENWGFGSALSTTLILIVSVAIALLIKFGEAEPKK